MSRQGRLRNKCINPTSASQWILIWWSHCSESACHGKNKLISVDYIIKMLYRRVEGAMPGRASHCCSLLSPLCTFYRKVLMKRRVWSEIIMLIIIVDNGVIISTCNRTPSCHVNCPTINGNNWEELGWCFIMISCLVIARCENLIYHGSQFCLCVET